MTALLRLLLSSLLGLALLLRQTSVALATESIGNVGVCYEPVHNEAYPLTAATPFDEAKLRAAIDADFAIMAQYFTHVRTYQTQYHGINITDYAAKHGLKIDLGVFMTPEPWQLNEVDAAIVAIQRFPQTIETVLVGSDNLPTGTTAAQILTIVNQIKAAVGPVAAAKVKFGTAQPIMSFMAWELADETRALAESLDVLGVSVYPFMIGDYDWSDPSRTLDNQWNQVANGIDANKMRLVETGFPTAGAPSTLTPDLHLSLSGSSLYYDALIEWVPASGDVSFPKFWRGMFDRRPADSTFAEDSYERHWGFFTHDRQIKQDEYPFKLITHKPQSVSRMTRAMLSSDSPITQPTVETSPTPAETSKESGCSSLWANCGGSKCCPTGSYCQPWSLAFYQCIPVPAKCSEQFPDTEIEGSDLGDPILGLAPTDCCSKCSQTKGCKGYTFDNKHPKAPACYLKSSISSTKAIVGVVSGVVD